MRLLVFGDYTYGDADIYDTICSHLDEVDGHDAITELVTFDEDGVSYISTIWAYDAKARFKVLTGSYPLSNKGEPLPDGFLEDTIKQNKIDSLFFYFVGKKEDSSCHRKRIRYLWRQAKRKLDKPIYVNLPDKEISLF